MEAIAIRLLSRSLQGVEPFDEHTKRREGVFYRREWGAKAVTSICLHLKTLVL